MVERTGRVFSSAMGFVRIRPARPLLPLITLGQEAGQDGLIGDFERVLTDEEEHVESVRRWLEKVTIGERGECGVRKS